MNPLRMNAVDRNRVAGEFAASDEDGLQRAFRWSDPRAATMQQIVFVVVFLGEETRKRKPAR